MVDIDPLGVTHEHCSVCKSINKPLEVVYNNSDRNVVKICKDCKSKIDCTGVGDFLSNGSVNVNM